MNVNGARIRADLVYTDGKNLYVIEVKNNTGKLTKTKQHRECITNRPIKEEALICPKQPQAHLRSRRTIKPK